MITGFTKVNKKILNVGKNYSNQRLQVLRDHDVIEFLGGGTYRIKQL
ncbi:MAG: hypothetical protein ACE5G7_03205 [Candidatus Hydrothermarchaeaceae archaeon]